MPLPAGGGAEPWALQVAQVSTDCVDFHSQDGNGTWNHLKSGDLVPEHLWPVHGLRPSFTIDPVANRDRVLYLHTSDRHGAYANVFARPLSEWTQATQFTTGAMGVFLGVMAVAVTWALLSARRYRDWAWLAFALFNGALALNVAANSGVALQFFFSHLPRVGDVATYGLFSIVAMAAIWYIFLSCELRLLGRWPLWVLWVNLIVTDGILVGFAMWRTEFWYGGQTLSALASVPLGVGLAAHAHMRGNRFGSRFIICIASLCAAKAAWFLPLAWMPSAPKIHWQASPIKSAWWTVLTACCGGASALASFLV
jgi:hypothetical protein